MVVASRLSDGRVVFLDTGGQWTEDLQLGAMAGNKAEGEALLQRGRAAEAANQVVEAYLITVESIAGNRRATDWRESIRACGPTVRTDLPAHSG
jgi:NaMN:DMB phosphoribosyltransferase